MHMSVEGNVLNRLSHLQLPPLTLLFRTVRYAGGGLRHLQPPRLLAGQGGALQVRGQEGAVVLLHVLLLVPAGEKQEGSQSA